MSSQADRLGLDHSDQSTAIVVNVAATFDGTHGQARGTWAGSRHGPRPRHRSAAAGVELDIDQHQHAQDPPEEGVRNREAPAPAQPVRLVGMQEPGGQEDRHVADRQRRRLRPPLEPEHDRIEEKPDHEVFPVDVDPPPVVGEARRQQVVVVRLGELEAEEVEHAAGHVKLARNLEIKQVVADQVASETGQVVHPRGRDQQLVVDQAIAAGDGPSPGTSSAGRAAGSRGRRRRSSRAASSGSRPPGSA